MWDITAPTQPQRLLTLNGAISPVAFSADGHIALTGTADNDQVATLWDLTPLSNAVSRPTEIACRLTGGGLSQEDWSRYIPDVPYQQTCTP